MIYDLFCVFEVILPFCAIFCANFTLLSYLDRRVHIPTRFDVLSASKVSSKSLIVVCDSVKKAHHLHTYFRSPAKCYAAGVLILNFSKDD